MWLVSIFTYALPIFFSANYKYYLYHKAEFMCSIQIRYLWFCLMTIPYIPGLCIGLMIFTTVGIIRKLRKDMKLCEDSTQNAAIHKKNMKAVKLILVTASAFALGFIPITMTVFIDLFSKNPPKRPIIVDFLIIWLLNSNSFVNVFIFLFIYSSFRKNFSLLLKRLIKCQCRCNDFKLYRFFQSEYIFADKITYRRNEEIDSLRS